MLKISETLNRWCWRAKVAAAFVLVVAAVACSLFKGKGDAEAGLITVGAIFPLSNDFVVTGSEAVTWGIHSSFGVLVAKETINKGKGILGKKLDLIILDGQGNPKIALQRYEEHKNSGVAAIIGPPIGPIATMMSEKAKDDGMLFLMQQSSTQQMSAARREYYKGHAAMKELTRIYYVNFGYEPPAAASAACECVLVLADAIEIAGGTNKKDVMSAMDEINQKILSNSESFKG